MQTFVTGGSGFLGRTLIRVLREKGHEVRALARSDAAVEAVRVAGAEPVRGDLGDLEVMRDGMAGCQWVFHSAAMAKSWGPRREFVEANVRGTEHVLEGCLLAAERGRPREVYFLTDGEPVEFRDFVTRMLQTQGVTPGNRAIPRPLAAAVAYATEALWSALRIRKPPPLTRFEVKV